MNKYSDISKELISSCSINFLFGAGVNGKAFKMADQFTKTINYLNEKNGTECTFEGGFDKLSEENLDEAKQILIDEFNESYKSYKKIDELENISDGKSSLLNIQSLFKQVNNIVINSENRSINMKQVNIFTLNYDPIIEEQILKLGYLCNSISANNFSLKRSLYNIVGYDIHNHKNIPTYLVSHLHGEINNPIIPGYTKYNASLQGTQFEMIFNMKSILSNTNAILFIIGYSCGDEHINQIIKDAITYGLTVYYVSFKEDSDNIYKLFGDKIVYINGDGITDSTKILSSKLESLCSN